MTKLLLEESLTNQELSDKWLPTGNVAILQVAMLHGRTEELLTVTWFVLVQPPKWSFKMNVEWDTDIRYLLANISNNLHTVHSAATVIDMLHYKGLLQTVQKLCISYLSAYHLHPSSSYWDELPRGCLRFDLLIETRVVYLHPLQLLCLQYRKTIIHLTIQTILCSPNLPTILLVTWFRSCS